MDATNEKVLKQLQEYAAMYFAAIVEKNTVNGKCQLKPGKYSARELVDSNKAACGSYELPEDSIFDESVEIAADNFKCHFPYRRIFIILAQWEAMSKAGKQKAVFEIGEVEEKSAKVLFQGKTALGKCAETKVKMQRVCGNWWMPSKFNKSDYNVELFYELNGVIFVPGLRFSSDMILNRREEVEARCAQYDDAKMTEMTISFLAKSPGSEHWEYFKEVADRAGINMESEEAAATIEKAKEEKRQAEERAEAERQESIRQREERERKRKEREEQERREAAEHLAKAKENFVSGKMISRNDFERIAKSIGYGINIRTLGTLRKRVEWIEIDSEGTPTVYGTKRRAGLEGTFAVIREVYKLLKEQTEEASEPTKHISEIIESCPLHDGETGEETDEWRYYKWLQKCHVGEYRTIAEQALIEVLANIFEAAHRKDKGHIIAKNKDGVLLETVIASQPAETPRISTEAAETVNVSAEGEKEAETKETPRCECPNYADYAFERGWSIENTDFDAHSGVLCMIHFDPADEKYVCGCLWQINSDSPNYTEHRRFKTLKGAQNYGTKRMGMKLKYQTLTVHCPIAPTEPPQSPETPQTVECTTDTPKLRETARKPQNRGIGSKRTTQRDTLRNILRPVTYVPRECSTVEERERVNPQTLVVGVCQW